ncbi:MAG: LptF/LptG family permease [Terrimonas sp.]|nr:LptF/LptG family permease [Terrimonas sp.]
MFRKLDILIIKAFIGPFVATFFITLLVLLMQFFWLYIDDFVGKGLSTGVILEFMVYQSAALVPLALPLAILLSSIMTFGNLAESMELVAIKSAGISLLRFMRPLLVTSILISGVAFLFNNYIIPVANLKSRTLLADIVYAKPAFDIQEGVFNHRTEDFAIKVGKKESDSIIRDVIIYEKGNNYLQDNFIIAKSGVMRTTASKRFLEISLYNGWRYEERGNRGDRSTEYIRLGFKEYKKQFDLSSLMFNRTNDTVNKNQYRMLSMRQLDHSIDSLRKQVNQVKERIKTDVFSNLQFMKYLDSGYKRPEKKLPDSVNKLEDILPDSAINMVNRGVAGVLNSTMLSSGVNASDYNIKLKELRHHEIEWHRKLTLSIACVVLFLIGAPLGSIIRKGGLGTPLIFAVIFFMFFYFLNTTGEKFVKENVMSSFGGMWMATLVLTPIGLFLVYKAIRDSQLFNKEYYFRGWKKLNAFARKLKGDFDARHSNGR